MIKGIFAINIAVKDLNEAVEKYEDLLGVKALDVSDPDNFAFPGITGAALDINGVRINLIASTQEDSPVAKFLEKKGEGVLLVSLEADDIDNDVENLKSKGVQFLFPSSAVGGFGKVNFVPPKTMNGVQWEILQPKK
jgi:methylmalonyl-CoA epimerase